MPSCRETVRAVAGDELEPAGFFRRLTLRLHLLRCPPCRRYAAHIRALGENARRLFAEEAVDESTLKRLRGTLRRAAEPGDESSS